MTQAKALLLTGAILSLVTPAIATPSQHPMLLAQAATTDATDPVAAAAAAVEAARAALRAAMASGQGVAEARANLKAALQTLQDARAAAGLPPAAEGTPPATEQTPPAATDQTPPPPPPANDQTPPPADQNNPPPPAVDQTVTPPPADQTTPPVPPTDQTVTPPADQNVTPPPPPPPPAQENVVTPPADNAPANTVAPPTNAPLLPAPVITLPPPVIVEPPPPPPPAAVQSGAFDIQKFKTRPKFGEAPPATSATTATQPVVLPKSEDALKEGAVVAAPDGRIIVKEGGQVTVNHDDSARFVQQGDKFQNAPSGNGMDTSTVSRPDGTQIVTVRDQTGNIVQRYRKNRNGSVDVLIGDVEQPGIVGRIFGKGPQPAPPRPRTPPALNLQLGPLQLTIPRQQYIVDSSQASEQQLQATLMAPPVERLQRTYTLDEIRRSGRLRDTVRRVDFDTIKFDTGQATVPDAQIPQMQNIGDAIRAIIQRDPTQVFLIEGHTDAVGSDLSNLALSDRRAETVAEILSYYFGIPPENLVTQGYGEQFLKVPTTAANQENRRVAFRNITSLLRTSAQ